MSFNLPFHFFLYLFLVVAAVALLARLAFRSVSIQNRSMRAVLFALRAAVLVILLFILSGPAWQITKDLRDRRDQNLFLIDTSASMGVESPKTRLDQARDVVDPILREGPYRDHVRVFHFDRDLYAQSEEGRKASASLLASPLASTSDATTTSIPFGAVGRSTNLAQALTGLLEASREMSVANIVVCSDGRIHDRERMGAAVRLAARHGVPVSTLIVGSGKNLFNLALQNCMVERHAPPNARITVRALISARGASGQSARLTLKNKAGESRGEIAFEVKEGLSEQTLALDVGMRSDSYLLAIGALPGEITAQDNAFEFKVEVADPRMRVLYMEGSNHRDARWNDVWEYDMLPQAWAEAGNIDVDVFTVDEQKALGGRLYNVKDASQSYPASREELFGYDVIICSDINRGIFSQDQLQWTVDLVSERGGGFCMIGGITSFGSGNWDKTIWEKLIPVDMTTFGEGHVWENIQPKFTEEGRKHPILLLDHDAAKSAQILEKHPAFRGTNLVNRAKPAATVLMTHPGRDNMPLVCVQPYGKGRTMAFTSDAAGGWGEVYQTEWGDGDYRDNKYYRKFWVNVVRWLGENSLAMRGSRLIGNTEAINYKPGDIVKVRARLAAAYPPEELRTMQVAAAFAGGSSGTADLILDEASYEFKGQLRLENELPPAPGGGSSEFRVPSSESSDKEQPESKNPSPDGLQTSGNSRTRNSEPGTRNSEPGTRNSELGTRNSDVPERVIAFRAVDGKRQLIGEDRVTIRLMQMEKEFQDLDPDPQLMVELARATNGKVIRNQGDIESLLRKNLEQQAEKRLTYVAPVWDKSWLWGLLIAALAIEWLIRKFLKFT
ncbi:MAG: glutamine amidotransferase [Candidatus Sumerlaeota bacterium]|nr:glutamine amidotransferase [Candidatus Sumerlaeota bacterium]